MADLEKRITEAVKALEHLRTTIQIHKLDEVVIGEGVLNKEKEEDIYKFDTDF